VEVAAPPEQTNEDGEVGLRTFLRRCQITTKTILIQNSEESGSSESSISSDASLLETLARAGLHPSEVNWGDLLSVRSLRRVPSCGCWSHDLLAVQTQAPVDTRSRTFGKEAFEATGMS